MALRKILLPLTGSDGDAAAIHSGFEIARQQGGHVEGVFLRFDRRYEHYKLPTALPRAIFDEVATLVAHSEDREAHARDLFKAARATAQATETGVPGSSIGPSAFWLGSRPADRIIRDAPLADLIIVGRSATEDRRVSALRGAVLATAGRPMLVVPPASSKVTEGAVVIAWNGGTKSARALAAALPFISCATEVYVLTAKTSKTRSSEADRLVDYLKWHHIKAPSVVLDPAGEPVGAVLLRHAQALGASMLVMGGHVRPRVQELLFGGVTNYIFEHAPLPVLVAQ